MALNFPVAVLLCDIGDPAGPSLPLAAAEAVLGPDGAWSVLDGWSRATYGYLDVSASRVIPRVFEIGPGELLDDGSKDDDGNLLMSRRKVGDRAVQLAEEAGFEMSGYDGVVVIARQGNLMHDGVPVKPYGGGAASLSDGRKMCNLAHDRSLYLMAHEVGHVFGYPESFGLRTRAWGWNKPPFSLTPTYGDPFCVMSASIRFDGGRFDYLATNPLSPDWPAATFDSAGPGPSLALTRQVYPAALRDNRCVRRLAYDEWRAPGPSVRLFAASDPTPGRVKLLVLDGAGRTSSDPEGTVYLEYRRAEGLDQGLVADPAATATACAAVVVHELQDTKLCTPENDENRGLPSCIATDGSLRARGRQADEGLRVHFRARLPVPPPLSRDWRAREDGPLIRVTDVAADGSWVEVSVAVAPTSGPTRSAFFRPVERSEISRTVAHRSRETLPALCGGPVGTTTSARPSGGSTARPTPSETLTVPRTYSRTIDLVEQEVTLRVAVAGFGNDGDRGPTGDNPQITWSVAGSDVVGPAAGQPEANRTLAVTVPVHTYDLATGESRPTAPAPVQLRVSALADGTLIIRSSGTNGNFNVPVTVTATSTATGDAARNQLTVLFTGQQVTRDVTLVSTLRACLRRIQDPSRLNQFTTPPWERRPRWSPRLRDRLITGPDRFETASLEDLNLATAAYIAARRAGNFALAREVASLADRVFGANVSLAAAL